jgi:hypothetical protein
VIVNHQIDSNNFPPNKPSLFLPTRGETGVSLTPELQTESFFDIDGNTHAETEWQISTAGDDFSASSLLLNITCDSYLTSITVPELILHDNTVYYWRVRFYDDLNNVSEWSEIFSFTTIALDDADSNKDGIPDDQEVDDTLDIDDNKTPDINQDNIKCVNTIIGDEQIGVKAGANVISVDSIKSIDPDIISDTTNKPDEILLGLISFKLKVENVGDTAEVTIYLSEPAPSGAKWYKYDSINGWQDYLAHTVFSADRRSVIMQLKDGGYGDADGVENGVIIEPSGLGIVNPPPSSTVSNNSGGCFIATAAFGSTMEPHIQILRDFRDRHLLNSAFGGMIVNLYYKYSPPVAQFIEKHQTVRAVVRIGLMPLIAFSHLALHFGFAITAGIAMLIIGLLIILMLFFLRRMLGHRMNRLQQEEI